MTRCPCHSSAQKRVLIRTAKTIMAWEIRQQGTVVALDILVGVAAL
jgi:hypothetical protein